MNSLKKSQSSVCYMRKLSALILEIDQPKGFADFPIFIAFPMPFAKLEAKVTVWIVEGCTEAVSQQMPRCLRGLKSVNYPLNLFLMIREKPTPP